MQARPRQLIEMLDLKPHPEGGFYRELYRAHQTIQRAGDTRCALTTIYYLLIAGQRLGPLMADSRPVCVVPGGRWQAAEPLGAYTLVGCTVGPGFDFADFLLLRDLSDSEAAIRARLLAAG